MKGQPAPFAAHSIPWDQDEKHGFQTHMDAHSERVIAWLRAHPALKVPGAKIEVDAESRDLFLHGLVQVAWKCPGRCGETLLAEAISCVDEHFLERVRAGHGLAGLVVDMGTLAAVLLLAGAPDPPGHFPPLLPDPRPFGPFSGLPGCAPLDLPADWPGPNPFRLGG